MFLLLFCFDSFWGVLCYFFCVWGGGGGVFLSMLFVSSFVFCVCSSPVVCCLR